METIQSGYEALKAAIIQGAYDDLVEHRKNEVENKRKARTAPTQKMKEDDLREAEVESFRAKALEKWLREVASGWVNLDMEKIIMRAKEVAEA